jgi:hypothetical protein
MSFTKAQNTNNNTTPKNSFNFVALMQDGSKKEMEIQLSTPVNTPGLRGIKGLKIQNYFSKIKDTDDKVALALVNKIGIEKAQALFDNAGKDMSVNEIMTKANFTSQELIDLAQSIENTDDNFEKNLEIYTFIIENIFATFGYDENDVDSNGSKIWYNIVNFEVIVNEFVQAYKSLNESFLTPSQNLEKNTGKK